MSHANLYLHEGRRGRETQSKKKPKKNGMKIVLGVPRQADKMIDAGPGEIYGKGKKKN